MRALRTISIHSFRARPVQGGNHDTEVRPGVVKLRNRLLDWPLVQQLRHGANGNGAEAMSQATRDLQPRTSGAEVARSICPYCAVGCGQLVFHRRGKLLAIEGDPASPISAGHLCPKGAASFELLTHDGRQACVKYRAPRSTRWQELPLEQAMDMIADRVWETRRTVGARIGFDASP